MLSQSVGFASRTDEELVFLAQSDNAPAESLILDKFKAQAEKAAAVLAKQILSMKVKKKTLKFFELRLFIGVYSRPHLTLFIQVKYSART